jgi:PST family polysaccharide transporter
LFVNFGLSTVGGRELVQTDQAGHHDVVREHFYGAPRDRGTGGSDRSIAAFRSDVISSVRTRRSSSSRAVLAAFNLGCIQHGPCVRTWRSKSCGSRLSLMMLFVFIHKLRTSALFFR